ncbi:hypothetical protein LRS06_24865 [Hymenobacter sp. J193]|uniref:hypothetical protein n=1 Tax=Hymenobacter sp. J193 TaxID=2898429 RepID=UPI002151F93D|nr:hypothetical protein [Hymenobacter sp. J193]MCR5890959.1 hypothetical protein [Hymenobacter sp. J193]
MSEVDDAVKTVPELAPDYFRNPSYYFWRWVEKGRFVEWRSGDTLCYREELARVLRGLTEQGLPPLASVLLLLAACADAWPESYGKAAQAYHVWKNLPIGPEDPSREQLDWQMRHVLLFLDVVRALPADLRTGHSKLHLFREVFITQAPQISAELASTLLDEWESGRSDVALHFSRGQITRREHFNELAVLAQAINRFPTTEALALHLRTGLDKLPEPLPEPEPPTPENPTQPLDLFEQLAQDPRTTGLARLAQHLGAALRIPLHTQGASDQPLGGVSDVTNRGNFDRLLLSELAHDDLSLMARLVNNEALYLRREEPPRQDARPRFILLDTTLRMWGVPRVFALAAALAWARSSRQVRPPVPVAAVALGGKAFSALDLESFEGVVRALELLDVAPHGGVALQAFARVAQTQAAADTLLITDAQLLHQPEFALALAEVKPALRFLLTVDRSGEWQLYEYQNGHRVPLSSARYDLEELLFKASAPARNLPPLPISDVAIPAFLQQQPTPLCFPTLGLRVSTSNTYFTRKIGVLSVNNVQRVLYWSNNKYGARELLPVIEEGNYYFGDDERTIYLLVSGKSQLVFYALTVDTGAVTRVDLSAELPDGATPNKVVYFSSHFYLWIPDRTSEPGSQVAGITVVDCRRQQIVARGNTSGPTGRSVTLNHQHVKHLINNGYNVLQRVTRMGLNDLGELVIEGQELRVMSRGVSGELIHELRLKSKRSESQVRALAQVSSETFTLTANKRLPFRLFRWPNGSEAVLDSRGLLHLRSANASVPAITLVLIINQPTAAWAYDDSVGGTVCGSAYFTGPNPSRQLAVPEFYQLYIQRFIEHLV